MGKLNKKEIVFAIGALCDFVNKYDYKTTNTIPHESLRIVSLLFEEWKNQKKEIDNHKKYLRALGNPAIITCGGILYRNEYMIKEVEQTFCGINELGDAIINEYKAVEK